MGLQLQLRSHATGEDIERAFETSGLIDMVHTQAVDEPWPTLGEMIDSGRRVWVAAESDPGGCDVIVWDGGNNDFPFYKPDLNITVVDPHRAGHELSYYPGEVTLRLADVVVINKMDIAAAVECDVALLERNINEIRPGVPIFKTSAKTGSGLVEWVTFLKENLSVGEEP